MTAIQITVPHIIAACNLLDEVKEAMIDCERATSRKYTEGRMAEVQDWLDRLSITDGGQADLASEAGIDAHAVRSAAYDAITELVAAWLPA